MTKSSKYLLLGGAALLLASAGTAQAQSATAVPFNWTGLYLGAHVGYKWASTSSNTINTVTGASTGSGSTDTSAPFGGIQGGYDYELPSGIVLGALATVSIEDSNNTTFSSNSNGTNVHSDESKDDWNGNVGARIGYAWGNALPFIMGGWAWSTGSSIRTQLIGTTGNATPGTRESEGTTHNGWTVGAGLEYALTPQWSVFGEYHYTSFGNLKVTYPISQRATTSSTDANAILVGLNFRFGAPPPPPPPMAPVAAPAAAPAPPAPPAQQLFLVFFAFDRANLTPEGAKVVEAAAAAFKNGKTSVAVAGYTDLSGTAAYNMALSKRRADTVKAALIRDGVPASAIDESWHGKENPRVPTPDGVRDPQNRRVEIRM